MKQMYVGFFFVTQNKPVSMIVI